MNTFLFRILLVLSLALLSHVIFASQGENIDQPPNFNIPQEILDRLPHEQVAPFLLARQRMLLKYPNKAQEALDIYRETNVTREAILRMPDDQIFQFFVDLKYIEVDPEQQVLITHHNGNAPPSPEQLIQLLFWLIGGALVVILLGIYLAHQRRTREQEIVLRALEVGEEIPLAIFQVRRQKAFLRWGILLFSAAVTIMAYGVVNHLSMGLAIIPASLGVGFLLAGLIVKD